MVTWAVPCFSCEACSPHSCGTGTSLFLPLRVHSAKGLGCVCPWDSRQAPSPLAGSPDERSTVTSTCGDVQLVLLSMACVSNCPSENATRKSSVARGGRGEKWVTSTGHREASFAET